MPFGGLLYQTLDPLGMEKRRASVCLPVEFQSSKSDPISFHSLPCSLAGVRWAQIEFRCIRTPTLHPFPTVSLAPFGSSPSYILFWSHSAHTEVCLLRWGSFSSYAIMLVALGQRKVFAFNNYLGGFHYKHSNDWSGVI